MKYDVMKAFKTVNRRLAVGGSIGSEEHIEPFSFEERVEHGFLKEHVDGEELAPMAMLSAPAAKPVSDAPVTTDKFESK